MKRQTTLAMFGIVFAAAMALGMVSVSGFSQPLFVASTTDAKATSQMGMFGHITLTATDPDGKITSYIQTDNLIVNVGENCVAESLFNVTTNGEAEECGGTGTHSIPGGGIKNGVADGGFTFIGIGDLIPGDSLTPENKTLSNQLLRIKANSTTVTASSGPSINPGTSAVVKLTGMFTASSGPIDVDESGIFDAADNMLARQTFGEIKLAQNDKLTVEWEITIGS